jgi:hypothetical protein
MQTRIFLLALAFSCAAMATVQAGTAPGIRIDAAAQAPSPTQKSTPPHLFLSTDGLQLSAFPSRQVLAREVTVTRTLGSGSVAWTASSDQPWLTVTPSGVTGQKLVVEAVPDDLPFDQFLMATVTVVTANSEFADTQVLRVGMWRGQSDPPEGVLDVPQNVVTLATNPVRPLAYVGDLGTSVYVYDVYSGKKVNTFQRVAPWIGHMTTSSDGSVLYVTDMTNYRIVAVDAVTGAHLASYSLGYPVDRWFRPVFARPYGQPVLLAPGGPMISVPSGEHLLEGLPYDLLAAPTNGRRVYVLGNDSWLRVYLVSLVSGRLTLELSAHTGLGAVNCVDLAVSFNGRRVYPACGFPYEFGVYDGDTLEKVQTLTGKPYPNNAEITPDGDFAAGVNVASGKADVFVYGPAGRLVGKVPTYASPHHGSTIAAMKISGDGTRVVMASYEIPSPQTLKFRSMP